MHYREGAGALFWRLVPPLLCVEQCLHLQGATAACNQRPLHPQKQQTGEKEANRSADCCPACHCQHSSALTAGRGCRGCAADVPVRNEKPGQHLKDLDWQLQRLLGAAARCTALCRRSTPAWLAAALCLSVGSRHRFSHIKLLLGLALLPGRWLLRMASCPWLLLLGTCLLQADAFGWGNVHGRHANLWSEERIEKPKHCPKQPSLKADKCAAWQHALLFTPSGPHCRI